MDREHEDTASGPTPAGLSAYPAPGISRVTDYGLAELLEDLKNRKPGWSYTLHRGRGGFPVVIVRRGTDEHAEVERYQLPTEVRGHLVLTITDFLLLEVARARRKR